MTLRIYATSHSITPFTESTLAGDFIQNISRVYNENKIDIRLYMPKYGFISDRKYILREVIRLKEIPVFYKNDDIIPSVKSAFIPETRVQVYFLVYPEFYKKIPKNLADTAAVTQYESWDTCTVLFNHTSILTLEHLYWQPDIMLCINAESALTPFLLNAKYGNKDWYKPTKPVLILSNDSEFKAFSPDILKDYDIPESDDDLTDSLGLLKSAIRHSKGVIVLNNGNESKIQTLLEDKSVKKLLEQKREQYLNHSIQNPDENTWNETSKQIYHFLETI
jgi:starch synthase